MPDADNTSIIKKSFEKNRHLQVVNILKESIEVIIITKCILNLGISLTVDELLASILVVEKQLTKAISKDETIQFCVNTFGLIEVL